MPLYAYFGVLLFFMTHSALVNGQHTGDDVNFPTDGEIRLVLTQARRAVELIAVQRAEPIPQRL